MQVSLESESLGFQVMEVGFGTYKNIFSYNFCLFYLHNEVKGLQVDFCGLDIWTRERLGRGVSLDPSC
jgi:hypothetical protein